MDGQRLSTQAGERLQRGGTGPLRRNLGNARRTAVCRTSRHDGTKLQAGIRQVGDAARLLLVVGEWLFRQQRGSLCGDLGEEQLPDLRSSHRDELDDPAAGIRQVDRPGRSDEASKRPFHRRWSDLLGNMGEDEGRTAYVTEQYDA